MRAAKIVLVALTMATSVVVGVSAAAPASGDEAPQARTVWCC